MLDSVGSTLHLVLAVLGLDLATPGGVTGAVAITITLVVAAAVLLAIVAMSGPASAGTSPPHPRRAIDLSAPLAQSDPDAPGHARPRAPQSVASAT